MSFLAFEREYNVYFCPCRFPSLFSPSRKTFRRVEEGFFPIGLRSLPGRGPLGLAALTRREARGTLLRHIMISFTNISGAEEIGANCYLLEMDGTRIVLDSGMHPKKEGKAAMPDFDSLEPNSVEAVF